jgi:hypothetical protein
MMTTSKQNPPFLTKHINGKSTCNSRRRRHRPPPPPQPPPGERRHRRGLSPGHTAGRSCPTCSSRRGRRRHRISSRTMSMRLFTEAWWRAVRWYASCSSMLMPRAACDQVPRAFSTVPDIPYTYTHPLRSARGSPSYAGRGRVFTSRGLKSCLPPPCITWWREGHCGER